MPKPLKKVLQKKKPTNVIINPDLDEKGSPVVEGAASKIAYGVGYLAGRLIRQIGKDTKKALLGKPPKIKKIKEESEQKSKAYHSAVVKHHSHAARALAKSPMRNGTNMHLWHKMQMKKHQELAKTATESVEFTEAYKVGDTVVPKIGPHKGHPHEVIHVHPDGRYNIKPKNLRAHQIKYRLGAVAAKHEDLKEEVLDEISKRTAILYAVKAGAEKPKSGRQLIKRMKGVKLADKKLYGGAKIMAKEESLDELSTDKLKRYIAGARKDLNTGPASGNSRIRNALMPGRVKGVSLAAQKIKDRQHERLGEENLDELFGKGSIGKIKKNAFADVARARADGVDASKAVARHKRAGAIENAISTLPGGKQYKYALKTTGRGTSKQLSKNYMKDANFYKKAYKEEVELDELFGKGSIDTIGKHHAARSTKGKPNSMYHAIQRNRAARLRDIHKGTGPLGKTTMKGRMQYAKQDREEARKLKESSWWTQKNPDRAKTMSPDEHLGKIKHHTQQSRKFGTKSLMGQLHTRAAGRHVHYLLQKDKSVEAGHKALRALKENAHNAKMDMVDREHAKALKAKGMVADHSEALGPELCRASWCKNTGRMLHSYYHNGKVKHEIVKENIDETLKVSRATKKERADTDLYLDRRHDEIIRRHKQGHSTEKIAKDMKLHPAVVSASTGILK